MFHGEPNVSMEITGAAANDPNIAADLVAESANIESELAELSNISSCTSRICLAFLM